MALVNYSASKEDPAVTGDLRVLLADKAASATTDILTGTGYADWAALQASGDFEHLEVEIYENSGGSNAWFNASAKVLLDSIQFAPSAFNVVRVDLAGNTLNVDLDIDTPNIIWTGSGNYPTASAGNYNIRVYGVKTQKTVVDPDLVPVESLGAIHYGLTSTVVPVANQVVNFGANLEVSSGALPSGVTYNGDGTWTFDPGRYRLTSNVPATSQFTNRTFWFADSSTPSTPLGEQGVTLGVGRTDSNADKQLAKYEFTNGSAVTLCMASGQTNSFLGRVQGTTTLEARTVISIEKLPASTVVLPDDVPADITGIADGQSLAWNATNSQFEPSSGGGGISEYLSTNDGLTVIPRVGSILQIFDATNEQYEVTSGFNVTSQGRVIVNDSGIYEFYWGGHNNGSGGNALRILINQAYSIGTANISDKGASCMAIVPLNATDYFEVWQTGTDNISGLSVVVKKIG